MSASSRTNFFKSGHERLNLTIICLPRYYESGWRRVENWVSCFNSCFIRIVISFQRLDEVSFSGDASNNFKMIEYEGGVYLQKSFINFIVACVL